MKVQNIGAKSQVIHTRVSCDNAPTRIGKQINGRHFHEIHCSVNKTFTFCALEGICLHTKSRFLAILEILH